MSYESFNNSMKDSQSENKNYETKKDEKLIEMIKISNSRVALRTNNSIIFEDFSENDSCETYSYKPFFGENEIIYYCAYKENVLVSLKGRNNNYMKLIDLKKKHIFNLFTFQNEIIYISCGLNADECFAIEKPNSMIMVNIKNLEIGKRIDFDNEIKSIIQINEKYLFFANDEGFFIYDFNKEKINHKKFYKEKKFNPKNVCLKNNNIFLCGPNSIYIIKIDLNGNGISNKFNFDFSICCFCEEAPLICLLNNNKNKISILNISLESEKPLTKKKEKDIINYEINSIIFKNANAFRILSNGKTIQTFYF